MHPGIVNVAQATNHNGLVQVEPRLGSGPKQQSRVSELVKAATFQAMFVASVPAASGGALWILERIIMWLQVCDGCACRVVAPTDWR